MNDKEGREAFQNIVKIDACACFMGRESLRDEWQYRIEGYQRIPGEDGLTRADDRLAQLWLGFRDKGDDHRCFGSFLTRAAAENAMEIIKKHEAREIKQGPLAAEAEFDRMLNQHAEVKTPQKDRCLER